MQSLGNDVKRWGWLVLLVLGGHGNVTKNDRSSCTLRVAVGWSQSAEEGTVTTAGGGAPSERMMNQASPVAGLAGALKMGERSLVSFFLRSAQVGMTTRLR